MSNYDFHQLSPNDFELLARDLVQARDGIVLESFANGRDGGVDFRYARAGATTIVQCKHYAGTGLPGLVANLRAEAVKAARLAPHRYILVTSVALTPLNKAAIQAIFGSILSETDIIGLDDLNNLLGLHQEVEQRHFKLWLSSRAVVDRIVHNGTLVQSDLDLERIQRDIRRYVQSAAFPRALRMLQQDGVVIISGAPGVGKTTLAKMLLYAHLEHGYRPISILTDFASARNLFQKGVPQIFYYDDFIGATFLGERATAFTKNEDRAMVDFIELVSSSPTTKLVMTTRQHILNQAIEASEKLKNSHIIDSRCVLQIADYSRAHRAQILYNHLYFSDLPEGYREALLAGRFYNQIVDHEKFNPRLVEWLSSFQRVKRVPLEQYQGFVRNLLADPSEIWRHAYEREISDGARSVLLALYSYGGKSGATPLEHAFRRLHALRGERYRFKVEPSDWRLALRELAGSFIRPGSAIEPINPSVLDMLNAVVQQDPANAFDLLEGAVRFEQARRVWTFSLSLPGRSVFEHFLSDPERVAAAFAALLAAPRSRTSEHGVSFFDDSIELRVATLLEIAERFGSSRLAATASLALDALLSDWESGGIDVGDGVALLAAVASRGQIFGSASKVLRKRMIRALMHEVSTGCGAVELGELLRALDPKELDAELVRNLNDAAEVYRLRYFPDELQQCRTESDFDGLKEDLETLANWTQVNLEGPLHAVQEAMDEHEEQRAAHEDRQYDEWKEQRYEARATDRSVDDLFDSLRKPD